MRLVRGKKGNNLMKSYIHGDNVFPSREMIVILIQSIPKKNTFKSLEVELGKIKLRNMNITYATKHFKRKGRSKPRI